MLVGSRRALEVVVLLLVEGEACCFGRRVSPMDLQVQTPALGPFSADLG